jgi:hypothetical protein
MRDLIKQLLTEDRFRHNTEEKITKYEGSNEFINNLKLRLSVGKKLTQPQIDRAIQIFKKEYWENTVVPEILKKGSDLKNFVIGKGIETYKNLIRSTKKELLKQKKGVKGKVMVGKPGDKWIESNINDLIFLRENINDSGKRFKFDNRDYPQTITQEINELLELLEIKDFYGFIEEDGNWSILNRLGSNFSNWAKEIGKRDKRGDLVGQNPKEKIEDYFKQKNTNDVLGDLITPNISWFPVQYPTFSFAELDLINSFHEISEDDQATKLEKIKKRIKNTTYKGEMVENSFLNHLVSMGIPKSDIKNFSSWGNLVDITFSIDCMVKLDGVWVPIQVKSSESAAADSQILKFDIGGISVFPAPKSSECGNWIYYKKQRGLKGQYSFDEDFLHLQCDETESDTEDIYGDED